MKQLARRVGADFGAEDGAEWALSLERGWKADPSLGLSEETARELASWVEALDRLVPDDFDYFVDLSEMGYSASLEYRNGAMCGGGTEFPVELDKAARRRLVNFNWERVRQDLIKTSESIDEMFPSSGPIPDWFKEYLRNGGKP